ATGTLVIAGVRQSTSASGARPRNYAAVVVPLGREVFQQDKHHPWTIDPNQILQYKIGSSLDPSVRWLENIDVGNRELTFFAMNDWFTFSVLICEDLARLEPAAGLMRSVGPNLVVALLMDGPQLVSRWPSRYA